MAWSYSDYESQTSNTARLTRLRSHIDEVNAKVSLAMAAGSNSQDASSLVRYLNDVLHPRRQELEAKLAEIESTDPRVTSAFTIGRPARSPS